MPATLLSSSSIDDMIPSKLATDALRARTWARYSSTPISPGPSFTLPPSPLSMVRPVESPIFILPNEIIPVTRYVVPSFWERKLPVPMVSSAANLLQSVVLPQISAIFLSTNSWHWLRAWLSIFRYSPISMESKSSIEKFGLFALHTVSLSSGQISWI